MSQQRCRRQSTATWLAAAILSTASTPVTWGVITYTTPNDAVYAVAPTGTLANSGWQWQGAWHGIYTATAIGPQYVITAAHTSGFVGDTYTLNGVNYTVTRFADGAEYKTIPNTDMTVWRVVGSSNIADYAPLYDVTTDGSELNKTFVVYGRGVDRGAPVTINSTQRGWYWGAANHTLRWGQNSVASFANLATAGDQKLSAFTFDSSGITNEAALADQDSGGGMFIKAGSAWKLAGINYGVNGYYSPNASDPVEDIFGAALYNSNNLFYRDPAHPSFSQTASGPQPSFVSRVGLSAATIRSYTNNWTADANGSWATSANWLNGTPASTDAANFSYAITAPRTITVSAPVTTAAIGFDNNNAYTIAGQTITLAGSAQYALSALHGNHTITAPVSLARGFIVYVDTPASITLTNLSMNSFWMIKDGGGTITVPNLHGGGLDVNAGTLRVAPDSGALNVVSNVTAAGTLDLTNNDLLVDYAGSPFTNSIRQYLQTARNGGNWNGPSGITSSSAATDPQHRTAIGYAEASDLGVTTFDGQNLDTTSLVLKYTYYGDANLNGKVDPDDYALLDRGARKGLTGWINGDFNYDGAVNSADYQLIDQAYVLQAGAISLSPDFLAMRESEFGAEYVSQLIASIPEPSLLSSILYPLSSLLIMKRRRRRR